MWYDDDICFCGNKEHCPKKDSCLRAKDVIGIHTYSLFYKKDEGCRYYLPKNSERIIKDDERESY